ncbi:MAG: type II CAAX endopeptidase family protein [Oscillospiraceae bacterium]
MKRVNDFFKAYGKATIWSGLFFLIQIIGLLLTIVYKVSVSSAFAKEFLKVLVPLVDSVNYIDYATGLGASYIQLIAELASYAVMFSIIPIAIIFLCHAKITKQKPLRMPEKPIDMIILGLAANLFLSIAINVIIPVLPEAMVSGLTSSTSIATGGTLMFTLLTTGILGPIIEEVCFRYGVFRSLYKSYPTMAIIIQAAVFGIIHGNVIQGCYAFILGIIFGYVYQKSEWNLTNSIIVHCVINSSSVLIAGLGLYEYFTLSAFLISYIVVKIAIEHLPHKQKNIAKISC